MREREIGPIPNKFLRAEWIADRYHPGGPAPIYGGYRPCRTDVSWEEFCDIARAGETADMFDEQWGAHCSDTQLRYAPEGWYIIAPSDRVTGRGITIAMDAIKHTPKVNTTEMLMKMGISLAEIEEAREELQMTPLQRVHEADHSALKSFPRGRYVLRHTDWTNEVVSQAVHIDGKPCGPSCPQHQIPLEWRSKPRHK